MARLTPIAAGFIVPPLGDFLRPADRATLSCVSTAMSSVWGALLAPGMTSLILLHWESLAGHLLQKLDDPKCTPQARANVLQSLGWWKDAEKARLELRKDGDTAQLVELVHIAARDGRPKEALKYEKEMSSFDRASTDVDRRTRAMCAMAWIQLNMPDQALGTLTGTVTARMSAMIAHQKGDAQAAGRLATSFDRMRPWQFVEPFAFCGDWQRTLKSLLLSLELEARHLKAEGDTLSSVALPLSHFVVQAAGVNPHLWRVVARAREFRDEHRYRIQA